MDAEGFDLERSCPTASTAPPSSSPCALPRNTRPQYGLTRPEWRTLAALGSSGRMTATEVGIHSTMHKTKVSRAVFALEQRRWLKRTQDEDDRRIEHLELTAAGQQGLSRTDASLPAPTRRELGWQCSAQAASKALSAGLAAVETRDEQTEPGTRVTLTERDTRPISLARCWIGKP